MCRQIGWACRSLVTWPAYISLHAPCFAKNLFLFMMVDEHKLFFLRVSWGNRNNKRNSHANKTNTRGMQIRGSSKYKVLFAALSEKTWDSYYCISRRQIAHKSHHQHDAFRLLIKRVPVWVVGGEGTWLCWWRVYTFFPYVDAYKPFIIVTHHVML